MQKVMRLHQLSAHLYASGFKRTGSFFKRINLFLTGADIAADANLGNILLPHAVGVVIGGGVIVEDGCRILSGVVLGGTGLRTNTAVKEHRAPIIRRGTLIGTGAKVLGAVEIGEYCIIGANAVVTKDIPPRSVAVGIPAKVIRQIDDITELNTWQATSETAQ